MLRQHLELQGENKQQNLESRNHMETRKVFSHFLRMWVTWYERWIFERFKKNLIPYWEHSHVSFRGLGSLQSAWQGKKNYFIYLGSCTICKANTDESQVLPFQLFNLKIMNSARNSMLREGSVFCSPGCLWPLVFLPQHHFSYPKLWLLTFTTIANFLNNFYQLRYPQLCYHGLGS